MIEFELTQDIAASQSRIWAELESIPHHIEWMDDAKAIRFEGSKHRGLGVLYECDTKIGPLRTTDRMQISQWVEGQSISISHQGPVKGVGTISIESAESGSTIKWHEELTFPWFMGSIIGEQIASRILSHIWKIDLQSMAFKCEHEENVNPIEFFKEANQTISVAHKKDEWIAKLSGIDNYATGASPYEARYKAYKRWSEENSQ